MPVELRGASRLMTTKAGRGRYRLCRTHTPSYHRAQVTIL